MRVPVTLEGDRIETAVQGPENPFAPKARAACGCALRIVARSVARQRRRRLSAARASHSDAGTTERLGHAAVPGRAGHRRCRGSRACSSSRWATTSRCTCRPSTSIPRSRRCRSRTRSYYSMYLAKRIGPYATLGPRRGHLGAQRRRHRRAASSCSRRTTSIASGRRCSSRRWIACERARWCASSTRPIASSTCSGGISTRRTRRAAAEATPRISDAIHGAVSPQRRAGRPRHASSSATTTC